MKPSPTISWFCKCALMAAVVLAADRLATITIGTKLQQPAATARDGSLIALKRRRASRRTLCPDRDARDREGAFRG